MPLNFAPDIQFADGKVSVRSRIRFKADPQSANVLADMLNRDAKAQLPSTDIQKLSYWPSKAQPGTVVIEIEDLGDALNLAEVQLRHEMHVEAQLRVQQDRAAVSIAPDAD